MAGKDRRRSRDAPEDRILSQEDPDPGWGHYCLNMVVFSKHFCQMILSPFMILLPENLSDGKTFGVQPRM